MYPYNPTAIVVCVLSVVAVAAIGRGEESKQREVEQKSGRAADEGGAPQKVLRHAVFFKFKDGTSNADVGKVVAAFDALPGKIGAIKGYERGENVSRLGYEDGFTHCFLLTFADEAGRAAYLPHPEHKAFVEVLRPHLDKVFVVDYWGRPEKARKERALKHALFLEFKDGATADEVTPVEKAIAGLPSQCETVRAFEWGKNNSPEKHDEGFTHCFMFTFDDEEGLKTYGAAPAHDAVVEKIRAVADKARVLDFWTTDPREQGAESGEPE